MSQVAEIDRIKNMLEFHALPEYRRIQLAQMSGAGAGNIEEDDDEGWFPDLFGSHDYTRTHELCDSAEDDWCDFDNAERVLKLYAAPLRYGRHEVEEGDSTFIFPLGWVNHEVDEDTGTVSNVTGWHLLAPGRIDRRVLEKDGKFYIETHGTGEGLLPDLNEDLADWLWGSNVDRMRDRLEDDYD